ncbi:MAG: hypothetical protein Q9227_001378 [Pyrenula ochraceoflavens]
MSDGGKNRLIYYVQTYKTINGDQLSLLPIQQNDTGVTHILLAAIHVNDTPGDITLNDKPFDDPENSFIWPEVKTLQDNGIRVNGMLGGAAKGSFMRLDVGNSQYADQFEDYYSPLRDLIKNKGLNGLDLDVEEDMTQQGITQLVDRLKNDFPSDFDITFSPVASAMTKGENLSGFDYQMLECCVGDKISWYNLQFYNGFGDLSTTDGYDQVIQAGWQAQKIVGGALTNTDNGSEGFVDPKSLATVVTSLKGKYQNFGGVAGWEYFNSEPDPTKPYEWAQTIKPSLQAAKMQYRQPHVDMGKDFSTMKNSIQIYDYEVEGDEEADSIKGAANGSVIRISSYLFLRWIPGHHFLPIITTALIVYLSTLWIGNSQPPAPSSPAGQKEDYDKKPVKGSGKMNAGEKQRGYKNALKVLLSGVPHPSQRWPSSLTVALNILLAFYTADMVFRPLLYPSDDLRFARVGHVTPDSAKLVVREADASQLPLTLSYRAAVSESWTQAANKMYNLNDSTDFTGGITLDHLDSATSYEYRFSNNVSGAFTTPLANSDSLTFLTSSCIKARFPFSPFIDPLEIRGFHHLRSVLEKLTSPSKFMLFLGDFIYVDVPWRMSYSVSHYRSEYRRVYSSPSWNLSPALKNLPWLHTLDDHEIANDWSSGQKDPYPAAADPFWHYHVAGNPPIPPNLDPASTTFFTWTQGPASFFMLDTRAYRTNPEPNPDATILGAAQLSALIDFIRTQPKVGVKWKFIISSVPFTKNWRVGTADTWGGFLKERSLILSVMHQAEAELGVRIVVLSGDRHEFGAIRFPLDKNSTSQAGAHEFSVGPLSMFYLPVRSFKQTDEEDITIKYLPSGNSKVGVVEIKPARDSDGSAVSLMEYKLYIDGEEAWKYGLSVS